MEIVCKCGNKFNVSEYQLKRGRGKFCSKKCYYLGRSQYSGLKSPKYKHGLTLGRFYRIWTLLLRRCTNPSDTEFPRYGARGIKVLWENAVEFKSDMHESYLNHVLIHGERNTTIDRINNNLGYSKENCRWATIKQQQRNRRNNRLVTYDNQTLSIAEWSEKTGIKDGTLCYRLDKGWSIDKTLTSPVRSY